MTNPTFMAGLVLALGAGCTDAEPPAPTLAAPLEGPKGDLPALVFAESEADLEGGVSIDTIDLGTVRDLWMRVRGFGMRSLVEVEATLFAPSGDAFRVERAWFSPARRTSSATIEGLPTPVPVGAPKRDGAYWAFDLSTAIAGTDFLRVPQPGRWTVSVRLTTSETPIERTLDVEVTP